MASVRLEVVMQRVMLVRLHNPLPSLDSSTSQLHSSLHSASSMHPNSSLIQIINEKVISCFGSRDLASKPITLSKC